MHRSRKGLDPDFAYPVTLKVLTGWAREVDRSTPPGLRTAPAVAKPTIWVLETGWWKLHGHIDPRDIPGPA